MKTGLVVLHCVHPVQDDHVEVNVKVQRTAKALNEGHHAGSGPGSTGQSRALNQIGLNGSRDHREATTERIGPAGEEQAQGPGKAQNPLAHRDVWNDVID